MKYRQFGQTNLPVLVFSLGTMRGLQNANQFRETFTTLRCPEQLDIPRLLRDTHQQLDRSSRRQLWE